MSLREHRPSLDDYSTPSPIWVTQILYPPLTHPLASTNGAPSRTDPSIPMSVLESPLFCFECDLEHKRGTFGSGPGQGLKSRPTRVRSGKSGRQPSIGSGNPKSGSSTAGDPDSGVSFHFSSGFVFACSPFSQGFAEWSD
ncbi:hypothetical protein TNCT_417311 [Trichonephila clavata]|uniref:Uncharacterized protein n=1 Tax=Trichonephila clavata TaxID=2740835 RepID=A0A8X6LKX4_TRICU|nr:hypothetical protein TNCT_417311 [Trichonephila clavata]